MEAEFDSIDTNEGGMILFQEFTNWAFSKNFDLEDDIDSQAEVALLKLLNRTNTNMIVLIQDEDEDGE